MFEQMAPAGFGVNTDDVVARPRHGDLSRSGLVWGTVAGVGLGAAYVASPVAVWCLAAVAGLYYWAGRGLTGRERRCVLGLLGLAIALRLLAIALLFLSTEPGHLTSFFWDGDGLLLKRRSMLIRSVWLGDPIDPFYFFATFDRGYGWTWYLNVLAYIQYWLGPAPYAIHLFGMAMFLASAIALYRLVRSSYGRAPALLGLAILLFLPTPFVWSVGVLKESIYVLLLAIGVVATVTVWRGRFVTRVGALVILAASMAAINGIRGGALAITALALGGGSAASVVVRRVWLVLLVLVLLPFAVRYAWTSPGIQARIMTQFRSAALQHTGHVRTPGHSFRLVDQSIYSDNDWYTGYLGPRISQLTPAEAARFAIRALASIVVVPLPWQAQSASELLYLPQQLVWCVLVALAPVGLVAGIRRDPLVTCLLAGVAAFGAAAIAFNSGNIGTMVRHRDTVVPFVVWLSAMGAVATLSAIVSRSRGRLAAAGGEGMQVTDACL